MPRERLCDHGVALELSTVQIKQLRLHTEPTHHCMTAELLTGVEANILDDKIKYRPCYRDF